MIVRLLSASALALTMAVPHAQAAYRYHHASFHGYRHYPAARHHVSYGSGWTDWRSAQRENYDSDRERPARQDPEASAGFAGHPSFGFNRISGARPGRWCGWYARSLVGSDPGPEYNLARNWAHWGHAASPGVGVMVVWSHHVGMITGRTPDGQWIVKSGNDGGGVARERPRSIAGAIAFRGS